MILLFLLFALFGPFVPQAPDANPSERLRVGAYAPTLRCPTWLALAPPPCHPKRNWRIRPSASPLFQGAKLCFLVDPHKRTAASTNCTRKGNTNAHIERQWCCEYFWLEAT